MPAPDPSLRDGHATASSSVTDWFELRHAADPEASHHAASLDAVVRRYWPIIFAFIRHAGRGDEESRDLTQAFLADVLLGRGLLAMASPARGRFRSLLLQAVTNYLRDDHRRRTAGRRPPASQRIPMNGPVLAMADAAASPERAFAGAWVAMLVVEAADRLRSELLSEGREGQWTCFEHRVLRPALHGDPPASSEELRLMTGIRSTPRIMHAVASARRRFAGLLLEVVGTTTDDPLRVREEIGELLNMLEGEH